MSVFCNRPSLLWLCAGVLGATTQASAGDFNPEEAVQATKFMVDNLWILIAAALVFIMHLGFATLESGLTRQKNTVNILFKNLFIISAGILTYALCGFNIMYPGDDWLIADVLALKGWIGFDDDAANLTNQYADYTYWSDFIFQAMFAATAATIVSGAVAERVKLSGFMLYAAILVAFGYTIAGSWKWGCWLARRHGFLRFRRLVGSTRLWRLFSSCCGYCARGTQGQVPQRRNQAHPRSQHAAIDHRRLPAVARLVRLQRRLSAQRRPSGHIAGLRHHDPRRGGRLHGFDFLPPISTSKSPTSPWHSTASSPA